MKATGILTFTQVHKSGSYEVQAAWVGGRRIAISGPALALLTNETPECGKVYNLHGVKVRLVGREPVTTKDPIQMWQTGYIAMREDWLARFVEWYTHTALGLSFRTQKIDLWFMFGRQLRAGECVDIPKCSLTGILLRRV